MAKQQRFQFDALVINPASSTAIFRQLENQLREAIWQGRLKPGERLPSTRQLASELSVARNTIINAYDQLAVEGFIITVKGSGTRVTNDFPQPTPPKAATHKTIRKKIKRPIPPLRLAQRYHQLNAIENTIPTELGTPARPFRAHSPACKEFPNEVWARLATRRLRHTTPSWIQSSHPSGYRPLREAIADYLGVARGINTHTDQVVVTAGVQQGIELLAKLLIDPGDIVVFEEPCYTPAAHCFEMVGAKIVSIPVDKHGLNVAQLNQLVTRAKLIYVTPASQFPLGMTLSQSRRKALLEWATRTGAIIVEDDYNGEYRYRGRPLATLHSIADEGQVIYMGSFSKLLFPALRLGFMVVPVQLLNPLKNLRWLIDRHSPPLEQTVLTDFINQGHFARHLRKMRMLYAQRQHVLVECVATLLPDIMYVPALEGGLHLVGWLKNPVNERTLLNAAKSVNIELTPVSRFCRLPFDRSSVIMGYAPYTPTEIRKGIKLLKSAYLKEAP